MSVKELESAVAGLSKDELVEFSAWFAEYQADAWDRQIARDVAAGRLDEVLREVDAEIDAGKAMPL